MKKLILLLSIVLFTQYETFAQLEFELTSSQSMCITGKGPGQDATKNPYDGKNCFAIIENIGQSAFSIRTQYDGKVKEVIQVAKGDTQKVALPIGYELYLDPSSKGKAKVAFERMME